MKNLRRKLGDAGADIVETVLGVGYRLGWSRDALSASHLASPLGRRLLAAFVTVALSSVAVLTVAALVGADRGLASAHHAEREQTATRVAAAVGAAYAGARGWPGADLSAASATADAAGARLVVRDNAGAMVWPGRGMGPGMAGRHADPAGGRRARRRSSWRGNGSARPNCCSPRRRPAAVRWPGRGSSAPRWWRWSPRWRSADTSPVASPGRWSPWRPRLGGSPPATVPPAPGVDGPGELGEVVRAFDTMADQVVRVEAVRRRLAADVAHELRTPLAALQAGLEELRDGLREPDTERLAALHDQTLRLGRVIADLADLSAAESAALSLHPVDTDLTGIARAALAAQRPQLDAAGLARRRRPDRPGAGAGRPGPPAPGRRQPARQRRPLLPPR